MHLMLLEIIPPSGKISKILNQSAGIMDKTQVLVKTSSNRWLHLPLRRKRLLERLLFPLCNSRWDHILTREMPENPKVKLKSSLKRYHKKA